MLHKNDEKKPTKDGMDFDVSKSPMTSGFTPKDGPAKPGEGVVTP